MNDADEKLIDAWRDIATKSTTIEGTVTPDRLSIHRTNLAELFAAFDRALADTPTLVVVPAKWCAAHGAADWLSSGRCKRSPWHENNDCDLRPLFYAEPKP